VDFFDDSRAALKSALMKSGAMSSNQIFRQHSFWHHYSNVRRQSYGCSP